MTLHSANNLSQRKTIKVVSKRHCCAVVVIDVVVTKLFIAGKWPT